MDFDSGRVWTRQGSAHQGHGHATCCSPSQGTGVPGTDAEVEGESVKVVDVRSDWKTENGQGVGENLVTITRQGGASTVLVLP